MEPSAPKNRKVPENATLWVKLPNRGCKEFQHIELIMMMFPGTQQMVIAFTDGSKRLGTKCLIHDALVRELQELLGGENVVVK